MITPHGTPAEWCALIALIVFNVFLYGKFALTVYRETRRPKR